MIINFSIDDVVGSLLWLGKNKVESIYASWTFSFAKWLWVNYGISTNCNCLFSDGNNNLSMVQERLRPQFEDASDWLKFSFHGLDYKKSYSESTYEDALSDILLVNNEIKRICGDKSLSNVVRSHFFSGSEAAVHAWKDAGVREILTADDNRYGNGVNYNLSLEEISKIEKSGFIKKNGVYFRKTDIRLENIMEMTPKKNFVSKDELIVFTHERFINEPWIKPLVEKIVEESGYDCKKIIKSI